VAPAVDVHVHLRAPGPRPSPEEMERCRTLARAQGIERVHLLGNLISVGGYSPAPGDIRAINDNTLAAVRWDPKFFRGLCYLNPAHGEGACLAEIARCGVGRDGMVGIKLWVAVNARRPALDPILRRAAGLGVPVLHHAWYKTVQHVAEESDPGDIADLAARHPEATIVMAHLGGGGWRGVRAIAARPTVLVDTSGAQPEAGLVEYAVRELGARRVLFGSDWPLRAFAVQRARVEGAALPARERALILGGNARRLFAAGARP
jgi:predicted TIM-barrel fold metal-dependent hydrolase